MSSKKILYEDVYFYLDMTKDTLKKKDIVKAIKFYVEEKNKINIKGHYSILLFQSEGNPIFITDKKDSDIMIKAINENWHLRPKERSYFENGLFYIFSYVAETVRKKSKLNRIIVITDTPSDLNEEYQEALFNIVSKIKYFPTFIDILRIDDTGTRFFKDDVKLNILASDTKGGIFYIKNKKDFSDIIRKLVKNKQSVSTFMDKLDEIKINQEDYAFYSRLAKNLKIPETTTEDLKCNLCNENICPKCSKSEDILMICEDCSSLFHECCSINHTLDYNIGIPNIFRCPKCDVLLQIKEELIIEISSDDPMIVSIKDLIDTERNEGIGIFDNSPKITSVENLKPTKSKPIETKLDEQKEVIKGDFKEKEIWIGGYFGKIFKAKRVGDKIVYERTSKRIISQPNTKSNGVESSAINNSKKNKKIRFKICTECGTSSHSSEQEICHNCGMRFKK